MRSSTLFFLLTGTTLAFTSAINVYLGYSAWASQAFYCGSPVSKVLLHDVMIVEWDFGYSGGDRELYRASLSESLYNAVQTSVAVNEVGMTLETITAVETAEVVPTTEIKTTSIQTPGITIPISSTSGPTSTLQSTTSDKSTPPISTPPRVTTTTTAIPDATPTPLLLNGDFESSITPWITTNTGTGINFSLTGSTTGFPTYDGNNQGLFHQTNGTGSSSISQRIKVIPGTTYSFTAYSYYHHSANSCTLVALIDNVALGNIATHSVWTLDEYFFTPVTESVEVSVRMTCTDQGMQVMAVDEIEVVEVEMEGDEVEEDGYVPPVLSASYPSTILFPSSMPSEVAFPTITGGASCTSAAPYGRYSVSTTGGPVSRYRM